LLASGGEIIVVGAKPRYQEVSNRGVSNYAWSPINVGISEEIGTTIGVEQRIFDKYLAHFKKWCFYYYLPTQWPTQELATVLGKGRLFQQIDVFLVNRYFKMLCGSILISALNAKTDEKEDLGRLTLLPFIDELEERQAINLVLEDCLSLPQTTLPPQWAETVLMPLIPEIRAVIDEKNGAIAALNKEIEEQEQKLHRLEAFKKLLYATGVELEGVFAACLERCGGKVVPAAYSQEEFVLEYKTNLYLVECKGVGKSIALSHIRQLFDYMTKFEEAEGRKGKGILLGNAWRDMPLADREVTFPDNVVARGQELSIALVCSVEFFHVFCRFLAGEISGEAILDRITNAVGIVSFDNL
jgi:hypothetical protein